MRTRNRDVIKPPFPELVNHSNVLLMEPCPSLDQVQQCSPQQCIDSNSTAETTKSSEKLKEIGHPIDGGSVQPASFEKVLRTATTPRVPNADTVTAKSVFRSMTNIQLNP